MKTLLRLEEIALFGLSIFLFSRLPYAWWLFPLLLFVPDIGMVGYVVNSRVGAVVYNIVHHRGLALLLFGAGLLFKIDLLQLIGIMLFAHSTLDRVFDYGLKFADAFKHTHLSTIGKGTDNGNIPV